MAAKNALVVDDNAANRDFLERLLTQAGFEVSGASSGQEAMALLAQNSQIVLALLDMELPDMSGLQLTKDVRARHPEAYIVVATMHDERSLIERVFTRGGNCFLVKPHGFMELYKRLTTLTISDLISAGHIVIDQFGPRRYTMTQSSST